MRALRLAGILALGAVGVAGGVGLTSCGSTSEPAAAEAHVVGPSKEAIGKYLVMSAGCNDCHTAGYAQGLKVPESQWLLGVPVGWRGPWGTTYAANLRLTVKPYTEETFVKAMKARDGRPPMPWSALHAMTDADLGAVYAYIKSLGPAGEMMPPALPPGKEPDTLYVSMEPVLPLGAPATQKAK